MEETKVGHARRPSVERDIEHKIDPDEIDGDTDIMPYERAQEIAAQFEEIARRTVGDGIVRGKVLSIDTTKKNGAIVVGVDVPAEPDPEKFIFKKPKSWDGGYAFVRFIRHYGYGAGNFAAMIEDGVEVEVEQDDGEYELFVPEPTGRESYGVLNTARSVLSEIKSDFTPTEGFVTGVTGLIVYAVTVVMLSMAMPSAVLFELFFLSLMFFLVQVVLGIASLVTLTKGFSM